MLTALPETIEQFANAYQGLKDHPIIQFAHRVRQDDLKPLASPWFSLLLRNILKHFVPVPVPTAECQTDRDCPSRQSCLREKCKDPCLEISPCAANAECTVHNSLPLRTMSCTCLPGYTGKGDTFCDKIRKGARETSQYLWAMTYNFDHLHFFFLHFL